MASVSREPSGKYRVQFVGTDGGRQTLRLPTGDRKTAEVVAVHVQRLLAARLSGEPLSRETAAWLSGISDVLRQRLAKCGLIEGSPSGKWTVATFCADYLVRQTHTKPASKLAVEQAIRNLREFFGDAKPLASITEGDAHDFKRWLLGEGRSVRHKRHPRALSRATVAKRLQRVSAIFRDAARRRLIERNPFDGVRVPDAPNKERQAYVPAEVVERLIDETPDVEFRLLLAMARYLGVRVPSEPFSMTWDCVDWARGRLRVPSPKTAVHGKPYRVVPILPQVMPHLRAVFEQASEGELYIFAKLRQRDSVKAAQKGFWASLNLRQRLLRLLTRLGIQPWPRLWHNLRASAQTDLTNRFPMHVACEWLGNTVDVARAHYLQVTDSHFEAAIRGDGFIPLVNVPTVGAVVLSRDSEATQNPTLQPTADSGGVQKFIT
jgi:integrase